MPGQQEAIPDGRYVHDATKFAIISIAAATTDGNIVTAVAGRRIRVLGGVVSLAAASSTIVFNSKPAGAGTAITGTMSLAVGQPASLGAGYAGPAFETKLSEGLTATTVGAGGSAAGFICYIEVHRSDEPLGQ